MKNKKTHEVLQDALQKHDFINFYQHLSSPQFPWFLSHRSNNGLDLLHVFYDNFSFVSNFSDYIKKIIHTLQPEAMVGAYARLNWYKKNTVETYEASQCHTAILFVNTNDSFYKINDSKINSVANSILVINPNVRYSYNLQINNYPVVTIAFRFLKKDSKSIHRTFDVSKPKPNN